MCITGNWLRDCRDKNKSHPSKPIHPITSKPVTSKPLTITSPQVRGLEIPIVIHNSSQLYLEIVDTICANYLALSRRKSSLFCLYDWKQFCNLELPVRLLPSPYKLGDRGAISLDICISKAYRFKRRTFLGQKADKNYI